MARIAIIGTGRMGSGLATVWSRAGHDIVFGSRHPEDRKGVLDQVPGAQLTSQGEALEGAEVVVLAIPYRASEPFAQTYAEQLRDKLVIDISNPFH